MSGDRAFSCCQTIGIPFCFALGVTGLISIVIRLLEDGLVICLRCRNSNTKA